jgi:hypothetical protein
MQIQYSETHSEELHLPVELLSFDPVKPRPAPAAPPAAAAAGAGAGPAGGPPAGQLARAGSCGRGGFSFALGPQPDSVDEVRVTNLPGPDLFLAAVLVAS